MDTTRTNSGKTVWETYHEFREQARRTARSKDEFSNIEQDKFDLDTAEIDGTDNPDSFRLEPYGGNQDPVDYRDVDPRF